MDHVDPDSDPAQLALQWLDEPGHWPARAARLYADAACYRAPARGLVIVGRQAVLSQLRADAARLAGARHLLLRGALAGDRLIDESVFTFEGPAAVLPGMRAEAGGRLELKRTRLIRFSGGLVVDELCMEAWTRLGSAG